jgi:hypothetical protein
VPPEADDPARQLSGDPAALLLDCCPRGGMSDALDRVVVMGDDRPLLPDSKVNAAGGLFGRCDKLTTTVEATRRGCPQRAVGLGDHVSTWGADR